MNQDTEIMIGYIDLSAEGVIDPANVDPQVSYIGSRPVS
jgi:hypothetical protein